MVYCMVSTVSSPSSGKIVYYRTSVLPFLLQATPLTSLGECGSSKAVQCIQYGYQQSEWLTF